MSPNSLFFDWGTGTFEHRAISTSECFDFVCLPHNLLGLHFKQKRCNCVNESCNEKEYTTIFHSVDVGAVQTTKMKSFDELLKAADKRFQYDTESCQCGNKIEHVLSYAPHFFTAVFSWPIDKESHVDMSGVLISITAPWDLRIIYEGLYSESKYSLNTAVCCVEDEHFCFAREEGKWLIYERQIVEACNYLLVIFPGFVACVPKLFLFMICVCTCNLLILGKVCFIGIAARVSDPKSSSSVV